MNKLNKKGFTLIEVVLVLAIGGLIFLLAFVAFQQVSRNRRDTQRRADAARVVAELENYKGDKGDYPVGNPTTEGSGSGTSVFGVFINTYMRGSNFKDPQGSLYAWVPTDSSDATFEGAATSIFGVPIWPAQYAKGKKCSDGSLVPGSSGNVAVRIRLESGTICRDNT